MQRLLIALSIFILSVLPAHAQQDKDILDARIEKANYCQTNDDCVMAGFECPFACVPYVNKKEAEELRNATNAYAKKVGFCDQDCAPVPPPDCVNGKCVPGKGDVTKPHSK